jgi:site-specific DNA-methyltransferase (adenine-specific)
MELKNNNIYNLDCLKGLKLLKDKSVDLTVTSPPYDDLRNYKGYSFDFENIAKELYRVTKDGGVVVWVVSDKTHKGSETLTSFKQAIYFKEIGFNVHDTMIYAKENWIPLTHNRYEQQFEYMFVFSRGKPKTFNPLTMPTLHGGKTITRSKTELGENKSVRSRKHSLETPKEKRKPNIWTYKIGTNCTTKDSIAFQHPAIFPEQLAIDHILSWSNEGDLILDPFMGSGTVAKMAVLNKREYIGFEISEEYCKIAEERLKLN